LPREQAVVGATRLRVRLRPKSGTRALRGVGHAPTLIHDDQIGLVKEFLLER